MSIPITGVTPPAEWAFISALDPLKVGIGPSSPHTVGPLRAARAFVDGLVVDGLLERVASVECILFGSLGSTGVGHGTPGAVLAGLAGHAVETDTHDDVERVTADAASGMLRLADRHSITLRSAPPVSFGQVRAIGTVSSALDADTWLIFAPREVKTRHYWHRRRWVSMRVKPFSCAHLESARPECGERIAHHLSVMAGN